MIDDEARRLLENARILRSPCDLDLLLFFSRHPHALLASESLPRFLGYEIKVITRSLDQLLAAGLLLRRQTPTYAARLYVFTGGGADAGWVSPLLQFASTRHGRRTLIAILNERASACPTEMPLNDFEYGRAGKAGPRPVETPKGRTAARHEAHGGQDREGNHDA